MACAALGVTRHRLSEVYKELAIGCMFYHSVALSQCSCYCRMFVLCRSRYCGEMTAGSSSLRDLLPSAKSLYYIRKMLKKQHLIKSQVTGTS